ncbi:MAG: ATP-binding protein [Rhodobacteraceae bacterium]|nr:ATP-binding protein [Paracoccaceae bacterium]
MAEVYSICCESSDLAALNQEIDSIAEAEGWSANLVFNVQLVLEELILNIFTHGDNEETRAWLDITPIGDGMRLCLSDNAKPFNILEDSISPDIDAALDERSVGGLGVHLVRTLASDLVYERKDDLNILRLTLK